MDFLKIPEVSKKKIEQAQVLRMGREKYLNKDDNEIRLELNNERLNLDSYFDGIDLEKKEKILKRLLNQTDWHATLFTAKLEDGVRKEALPVLVEKKDISLANKIAQSLGRSSRYIQKLLDSGLDEGVIYDCAELASNHGPNMNSVVSLYQQGVNTDMLSMILKAKDDLLEHAGMRLEFATLKALLVFCHGNDDLKKVDDFEVSEIFHDAIDRLINYHKNASNQIIIRTLRKVESLDRSSLDDLFEVLADNLAEIEEETLGCRASKPIQYTSHERSLRLERGI